MHTFRQSGETQWSVFFYGPAICHQIRVFGSQEDAAAFVNYLNGGFVHATAFELLTNSAAKLAQAVEEIMHRMDTTANKRGKK